MNEHEQPVESVAVVPSVAEAHERAAIDVAVSTARRYPRTIKTFQNDLESWACATTEIATECFYVLERENRRTGKVTRIVGPSVRFAELVLAAYRNLAADVKVESDDGTRVTVVAVARDMERNVAVRVPVVRRVVDRDGRRYSDDMVTMTIMQGAAVAKRNAIIGLVPRALWTSVLEKAKALARGDTKSLTERLGEAIKAFAALGVREENLIAFLGKPSLKDVDADDLLALRVVYDEIKKGERDPDTIRAAEKRAEASPAAQAEAAAATVAATKAGRKKSAPAAPETAKTEAAGPATAPESTPAPASTPKQADMGELI